MDIDNNWFYWILSWVVNTGNIKQIYGIQNEQNKLDEQF